MISRENQVQIAAIAVGGVVALVFAHLMPQPPGLAWLTGFLIVFYAITLGGPHIYLYRRSNDGEIPGSARRRFLVFLAIVLPIYSGVTTLQGVTVGDVDVSVVLGVLSVVTLLAYFVNEMRHGYADFAEETNLR